MQQALNLNSNSGDEFSIGLSTAPLTDAEFTDFRDGIGTLIKVDEFRQRIFHGGLEPSLRFVGVFFYTKFKRILSLKMHSMLPIFYRRIVWKHLLNVYPEGLNGSERMNYIRRKSDEYGQLKSKWICHYQKKEVMILLISLRGYLLRYQEVLQEFNGFLWGFTMFFWLY